MLYDFGHNSSGSFNFTAQKSGIYHFSTQFGCDYGFENPILPTVNLALSLTGVPIKIALWPPNQTYREANVSLGYGVNRPSKWLGYSLDGQENVTVWENIYQSWDEAMPAVQGNLTFSGLANGVHTVTVYANDTCGNLASQTVVFRVNTDFWVFPAVLGLWRLLERLLFYHRHQNTI